MTERELYVHDILADANLVAPEKGVAMLRGMAVAFLISLMVWVVFGVGLYLILIHN